MQYARQAKLGRMTGKLPKLEAKWIFLNRKAEMLSNNSSKISNSPSCLFLGKEKKFANNQLANSVCLARKCLK